MHYFILFIYCFIFRKLVFKNRQALGAFRPQRLLIFNISK